MLKHIAELLAGWNNILVLCHASPDGDTLGSAAALVLGLKKLGKNAAMACGDEIPGTFDYFLKDVPRGMQNPERIVTVDVAGPNLLGTLQDAYRDRIDLAIDHHIGHTAFAGLDFVDAGSAANAEIMFRLLALLGVEIDKAIADCLYTALATDTGCFRYRNVTAETHRIAGELITLGADFGDINQRMFETKTRNQLAMEVLALSALEYYFEGKCAMIAVTQDMMRKAGIQQHELDAIVSKPRQIAGVYIGVTLKEKEEGGFKISVRTNKPANASEICKRLGGGGHQGAAGCTVSGDTETARSKILAACEAYMQENAF